MPRLVKLVGALLVWFGCVGPGLVACSSDDDTASPPRGPKTFAIAQVGTTTDSVTESGASLGVACDEPLLVWISPATENHLALEDFVLAPPGGCGNEINCGWIEWQAIPPADASSPAEPAKLPDIATQSVLRLDPPNPPNNWQPGEWTVRVGLVDSEGQPVLTDQSKPLSDKFLVNLVLPEQCPPVP